MSYPIQNHSRELVLQPGQYFGPYQIERMLGEGAVAVAYSARAQDGRMVALKILKPSAAQQAKLRQLFRNEYQLAAGLRHPGIVQVYELGEAEGLPYIAMALVNGPTLESYLTKSKTLGETASVEIARQLALTLDYIHRQGIVHRDLKPANILIDTDGKALVFDFGAAIRLQGAQPADFAGLYGTPAFAAPEQIRSTPELDGRADLYSLGIILYRMLSGRKPFYGDRNELLEAQLNEMPPKPSDFAYVSPELEAVILKALAKSPTERYQSGAEFAAALQAAKLEPPPERISFTRRIADWFRGEPATP
jgi:serine/threonine protein kinase